MRVRDILHDKGAAVATIGRGASLKDAADVLSEKGIGAVVVVDAQRGVAGILSERDIVRAAARSGPDALASSIESAMTTKVVTCSLDDTVDGLMETMTTQRIRHLPVLEDGALAGIVSIGDVVKRKIRATEQVAEDLKAYIATG